MANLFCANMIGACLYGAELSGAGLMCAFYDDETVFSEGFDPKAHGMVKV